MCAQFHSFIQKPTIFILWVTIPWCYKSIPLPEKKKNAYLYKHDAITNYRLDIICFIAVPLPLFMKLVVDEALTGGNWQNEKEYSWHVPAIKFIGMKQLVSKVGNILEKLRNLWTWEIWGNIVKIWYFVNNFYNWSSNSKFLLHMCDTYNCDYLKYSTLRFNLIDFQLNTDFPSQICVFYRKIT